ncbi:Uma2 family endonuclease [Actinocorallia sp. A-T 12471]|uniref:Uma2 family endonuclease n=1 Tax=Actinocorallia sp. A-T 12471 TaxID=3089813 RepID=UPI0029CF52B5|nr:Uma2 family endonuclease [Actinocorallia sp. A-T 12471]MDX6738630.1 Uma2 family endonuclease [Actinocorallia sp. A-T 12471]
MKDYPLVLPDTPYNLWVSGALDDYLHPPEDFRVEIINGEIVLSPAPAVRHNRIVQSITYQFNAAHFQDPDFPWTVDSGSAVNLVGVGDGYVPDLIVVENQVCAEAEAADVGVWVADQIEMAVEVTSKGNPRADRPTRAGEPRMKWSGYARAEIPYYLLVDRDPKIARVTLFSVPDANVGAYLQEESWDLGKPVTLPEHLGVTLATDTWRTWGPDGVEER